MVTSFEVAATLDGGAVHLKLNILIAGTPDQGAPRLLTQAVVMPQDTALRLAQGLARAVEPKAELEARS